MRWITATLTVLLLAGCSKQEAPETVEKSFTIYAVNYPLAWMAEQMAVEGTVVVFPEMEGDPAFWEPTPGQVAEFQNADIILLNGASYAKWIPKVSLPEARLVDTSSVFKDRYIALDGTITHTHGPSGAHAHGDLAFTTWLDPQLAMQQSTAIYTAMAAHEKADRAAYDALQSDLAALDTELEGAFALLGRRPLLGSHPVYQYLERRYGLNMESVHWEPDAAPDAGMWQELEDILEAHDAGFMLWEGEPLPETVVTLLELGITSIVFDPCGNRPESGDYLSVMQENISNINAVSGKPAERDP